MRNRTGVEGLVCALLFFGYVGKAAEINGTNEIKPVIARPGPTSLEKFKVKKGFRIELATLEGMVSSPVALAFDENGRLFVAEMRDYPDGRQQTPHIGRVRLLQDQDGDGVFDSSQVYADNLPWPSAIACYSGGIFVGATPEIIYFKDTAGNGVADLRKVVFTGFGATPDNPNVDALLNNFVWGLDNRIHGGAAGMGGIINPVGAPGSPSIIPLREDFSFDPNTLAISIDGGTARSGLQFDARGRKYVSNWTHPLQISMFEPHYYARNPFVAKPPQLSDVINPATRIFRTLGETTNTATIPTRPGSTNAMLNAIASAWMTKSRGCLIYLGSAFPPTYLGNAFVCDPDLHVIHRSILVQDGLGIVGQRARDEAASEFLVSTDPSFHPTQLVTGPDGALYIADIQVGGDSGRIFRIVPEGFKYSKPPQFRTAKTFDLVVALAHPNSWHRQTAARLLFERRDPITASHLTNMVNKSQLAQARLQALHMLDGLGVVTEGVVVKCLRDPDESVREHAIALSERLVRNGKISDAVWARFTALTADPSIRVRYQLAFTLGEIERPERTRLFIELLQRELTNPWFRGAVLSSVSKGASDLLATIAGDSRWRNDPIGLAFLNELGLMIGERGQMNEVTQSLNFIENTRLDQATSFSLLRSLGEGLHRMGSSLALVDPQGRLQPIYDQSLRVAMDDSLRDTVRLPALQLRTEVPYASNFTGDILQLLFGTGQSEAVQSTAVAALARYDEPTNAVNLIARWKELPAGIRRQAIGALLSRTDRIEMVMDALDNQRITPADFSSTQINFLRTYRDAGVSQRAQRIFGPLNPSRADVVGQFKGSLRISGAAARGRETFRARCASCHRLEGSGNAFGPDLTAAKTGGKENLLTSILEPNRVIASEYVTWVAQTRRQENLVGLLADDNGVTIDLRQPPGTSHIWPRSVIQDVEPQPWSLMPEGLEQGLNVQMMADLLEYLMTAQK